MAVALALAVAAEWAGLGRQKMGAGWDWAGLDLLQLRTGFG